jgi:hypothetical protein
MSTQTTTPKAPRDGSVSVGGYPWLGRMIDKARLDAAGQIAVFDLDYNCPMDQRLLAQLGLDAKTFQAIVVASPDDLGILQALQSKGISVQLP